MVRKWNLGNHIRAPHPADKLKRSSAQISLRPKSISSHFVLLFSFSSFSLPSSLSTRPENILCGEINTVASIFGCAEHGILGKDRWMGHSSIFLYYRFTVLILQYSFIFQLWLPGWIERGGHLEFQNTITCDCAKVGFREQMGVDQIFSFSLRFSSGTLFYFISSSLHRPTITGFTTTHVRVFTRSS